ncbi:MAG: inositol monophosphatase family protein [Mariprofundaceae bacterium]
MSPDIDDIASLIKQAGQNIILPAFQNTTETNIKSDGSIVTKIDLACQELIEAGLKDIDPDTAFLGEEMTPAEQRQCLENSDGRYWCLDPLDGTTNFVASLPIFASSLALIENGQPVLACIHDPVRGETFSAIRGKGAWNNGAALHTSPAQQLKDAVGFIDFKRLSHGPAVRLATEKHYRSQRNIGTCALEWAWLAAGRAQFIIHGRQKLWDYAAGALLVSEAGGMVSDFEDRDPFTRVQLESSVLAAADRNTHQQLNRLLAAN